MTTCILKNGFNFMQRLRVPVPAFCNAWPVKNTDMDVIFSSLARCVLNVHVVLSVDLFPLALYWSLVNFVHIVVLFVLFVLVTAACGRWSPCVLGDSGGVVNFLDFCPASLKSLGCFYFRCVLSSQWKAVTVNLLILHCQR